MAISFPAAVFLFVYFQHSRGCWAASEASAASCRVAEIQKPGSPEEIQKPALAWLQVFMIWEFEAFAKTQVTPSLTRVSAWPHVPLVP